MKDLSLERNMLIHEQHGLDCWGSFPLNDFSVSLPSQTVQLEEHEAKDLYSRLLVIFFIMFSFCDFIEE